MIISQTPYRVSFAGGGTDLPAFYRREFGAVLSTTIDQHMYVTIHRRFEPTIRSATRRPRWPRRSTRSSHDLVREAMRLVEIDEPLEITTIGDVPAGTGMGSSSSLTAGLLNALLRLPGPGRQPRAAGGAGLPDRDRHPQEADRPPGPVRGGLRRPELHPVQPRRHRGRRAGPLPAARRSTSSSGGRSCSTRARRGDADEILEQQSDGTADRMPVLRQMRDLADEMRKALAGDGDLDAFAELLHAGLGAEAVARLRDQLPTRSTSGTRRPGATAPTGGKLLGAGGGGFLLLMAPPGGTGRSARPWAAPRAPLPDRPARQPEHLHPAVIGTLWRLRP